MGLISRVSSRTYRGVPDKKTVMSGQSTHVPGKYLQQTTIQLYDSVIEEVLKNVRDAFYDEGLDDQVIHELRDMWKERLNESGVTSTGVPKQKQEPNVYAQQSSSSRVQANTYPGQ